MSDTSQSTKHTPGPWVVGHWTGRCRIPEHEGNHPGGSACVYEPELYPGDDEYIGGIASTKTGVDVVWTSYDELRIRPEDARLIAAAPELLEALERFMDADARAAGEDDGEISSEEYAAVVTGAKAAIRKAKGLR